MGDMQENEGRRRNSRWSVIVTIFAIATAQLLPGSNSSEVTVIHLVSVVLVAIASWFLLRGHHQLRRVTIAWNLVRWHALSSLTISAFIIAMRLCFPIASFPEAFNNTIQRVADRLVLTPVIGLLAFALILVGCSRFARSSVVVWHCACLSLTVARGPLNSLIH
jgi:hypothetical protein